MNEGFRYNPIPQSEYFNPSGSYLFPDQDYSRDLTTLFWPSVQAAQPPPPSRIQPNELRESFLRPDNINLEPLSQPLNLRLSELAKERGHKDWSLLPRDPSFDARSNSVQLPRFGLNPVSEPSAAVPTAPTGDPITSAKNNLSPEGGTKIFSSSIPLFGPRGQPGSNCSDPFERFRKFRTRYEQCRNRVNFGNMYHGDVGGSCRVPNEVHP